MFRCAEVVGCFLGGFWRFIGCCGSFCLILSYIFILYRHPRYIELLMKTQQLIEDGSLKCVLDDQVTRVVV
jgi:hypothetical protein